MNICKTVLLAFASCAAIQAVAAKPAKSKKEPQKWDAVLVQVKSSADGTMQPCWYWAPAKAETEAVALIVGLHTRSADYNQ